MEEKVLIQLTTQWSRMTGLVLELRKIPSAELQRLLKETYRVLRFYCEDNLVPKEISKILLEMDEFLYFASLFEKKEVEIDFYFYQVMHMIVETLKEGFFKGKYECEYPILKMSELSNNSLVLDFENGHIEDLL